MNEYKKDWNSRPKGCNKTTSGMHIPSEKRLGDSVYEYVEYCKACGVIDDSPESSFRVWLFGPSQKINDSEPI